MLTEVGTIRRDANQARRLVKTSVKPVSNQNLEPSEESRKRIGKERREQG